MAEKRENAVENSRLVSAGNDEQWAVNGFAPINPVTLGFEVCGQRQFRKRPVHLLHGADSLFQTLGWRSSRWERGLNAVVTVFCAAYFLGNLAIPGAALLGILH